MFSSKRCSQSLRRAIHLTQYNNTPYHNISRYIIPTCSLFNHPNSNHYQYDITNAYIHKSYRNIQTKESKIEEESKQDASDIDVSIQFIEDTLSIIQYGEKKIFLIGTDHQSLTSAQKVREVIEEVHPETIVLEICTERAQYLMGEIKKYKNMVKSGIKISKYQKKRLLIGGEFRTAIQEGLKIDAKMVYGDIDQRVLAEKFKFALKKSLRNPDLSLNDRLKLRMGTISWYQWFGLKWNRENMLNKMRNRKSMKERLEFMSLKAPYLQNGIMDERNDIISVAIRDCDGNLVVAVVGMDHMEGIEDRFKRKFIGIDLDQHKKLKEEMVSEQSMDRLRKLGEKDLWIGHEFDEFKYSRDLPQKMV